MKKSIFSALCLVLLATTTQSAWGATANFTYSDLTGQGKSGSGAAFTGATVEDITMTGVGYGNTNYVQIYAKGTFVFTPSNGATITKIVLTATTTTYARTWSASPGSVSVSSTTITWTGSSTSAVTLTNTASAQARITKMVVTYESGSTPATLYLGLFLAAFVAVRACVRRVECLYATFHHIIMSKIDFGVFNSTKDCVVFVFFWNPARHVAVLEPFVASRHFP